MNPNGLRERNKVKRRAAIVAAALDLFADRGYAATTIANIAEAAEIAPRTVSLYFPSKQEIALTFVAETAESLADALRQQELGTSTIAVFGDWLRCWREYLERQQFPQRSSAPRVSDARRLAARRGAPQAPRRGRCGTLRCQDHPRAQRASEHPH